MAPLPASGVIAVGEPSLGLTTDGAHWDFGPLFLAVVGLIVIRLVLHVRIRWYVAVMAVLLAPLAIAFAGWVGPPIAFATAAIALVAARSILWRGSPPSTV
jgi:hypothetical protein